MITRTGRISWTQGDGTKSSVQVSIEDDGAMTLDENRDAAAREVEEFARKCGWVPLEEETFWARLYRRLAGDLD